MIKNCRFQNNKENGIYIDKEASIIHIDNIRTYCDICGENLAEKYFVRGEDKKFNHYFSKSKLRWNIGINIIGVCQKWLKDGVDCSRE